MKIYISGKISGLAITEYVKNFKNATDVVWRTNNVFSDEIINPLDLKPFLGIKCWLCYMITDLYYLSKCTHIAMQSNWIDSRGAHWEHYFAKWIFKIKVIYL